MRSVIIYYSQQISNIQSNDLIVDY